MTYTYQPSGVCSKQITITVEEGRIADVSFLRGCNGNLQGIASLVRGMKPAEVVPRLEGIRCASAGGTSCPDQLARALKQVIKEMDEAGGEEDA